MATFKRMVAGASALALASGAVFTGAGIAGAQGSSEIASAVMLFSAGLNGAVVVTPNATGGPTVTYTNGGTVDRRCVGFTAPFSSFIESGIDGDDQAKFAAGLAFIEAGGGVSLLGADTSGGPKAIADPNPDDDGDLLDSIVEVLDGSFDGSVLVEKGKSVTWTATAPTSDRPSLAMIACKTPGAAAGSDPFSIGIDKQVVVDALNDVLPGGSIGVGSVTGGSVGMAATVVGSLGAASSEGDPATGSGLSVDGSNSNGEGTVGVETIN